MYYFGDGRVNTLLDDVQRDMKQGNYYSALPNNSSIMLTTTMTRVLTMTSQTKILICRKKRITNSSML